MKKKNPQEKGLRLKGNIWYVNLQIDGQRKEVRVGPEKSQAIALRSRLKLMAQEGSLKDYLLGQSEQKPFTYSEAVLEHWNNYLQYKKAGKTMLGRLKSSEKLFGNRDISTLAWHEIENFRNIRLKAVRPSTVKQDLDMMHAVLQRQVKMGRIKENPLDKVDRPTFNNVREEVISHAEFIKLLSSEIEMDDRGFKIIKPVDRHLQLALIIADFTGMRIGEVLNIRWVDIKDNYSYIYVPESKTQVRRQVPIHDELRQILQHQLRLCDYVVCYRRKKVNQIKKGFERIRETAGLPDLHIHDFRHRAITRWVQQGYPINAIMKATGHSTFSAFSRYANLKEGDVQVLVGRKTEPLPVLTFTEYLQLISREKRGKNVEMKKAA